MWKIINIQKKGLKSKKNTLSVCVREQFGFQDLEKIEKSQQFSWGA